MLSERIIRYVNGRNLWNQGCLGPIIFGGDHGEITGDPIMTACKNVVQFYRIQAVRNKDGGNKTRCDSGQQQFVNLMEQEGFLK